MVDSDDDRVSNSDATSATPDTSGSAGAPDRPEPYYPSLAEPLRLQAQDAAGRNATVVYDGRRITISRTTGVETVPLHQIATVAIRRPDPDAQAGGPNQLVFEMHHGRESSVTIPDPYSRRAAHFQEEVGRAISGHQPTGQHPPGRGFPVGLLVFFGIVVVIMIAVFR